LIVYDESHRLMESKKGDHSSTTYAHYQISNKDEFNAHQRIESVHPVYKELKELQGEIHDKTSAINNPDLMDHVYREKRDELDKLEAREKELQEQLRELQPQFKEQAIKAVERTKVVFLSATPFKAHFNLRYANGYLFDWGSSDEVNNRGSRVDAESRFFLEHFGSAYEWKYHQLQTKQNANAEAIAMQEIEFAERLMDRGVVSGRAINSERDYERSFPRVTGMQTDKFNEAFNDIFNHQTNEFEELREAAFSVFYDYNYTTQLLEALKTSVSIDRMKKHLDLGRKLVVFHRRKQANVRPPFFSILEQTRINAEFVLNSGNYNEKRKDEARRALGQIDLFRVKYAGLLEYEQTLDYRSAINQISSEFGDRALYINGDISKKNKSETIRRFNDDNSGIDIIVVQEESGKEGISLHDTTGKHQRVIMNMSMPISSITALQIEGRIYRIGQESDAIFEYPIIGLDMEVEYFGRNINRRLSTTENLAVGEQSRDLIRSFAEGILFNSATTDPNTDQGKGGKKYDRRAQLEYSEFRRAVLVYNTNQKNTGRRDQREGVDYFATPEPAGQKMVEWLGLHAGEKGLEPSAGHGAITMWFPHYVNITAIEPSYKLYSKLNARAGGGERKVLNDQFENHNIINKYDGIAMNPPFGTGGKTAIDHLEKAFKHLHPYGRIAAIIPNGGMMDRRFDKFLNGIDENGKPLNPDAYLVGEVILPRVTFTQAGTQISSRIVLIDKLPQDKSEAEIRREVKAENVTRLFNGDVIRTPEEIETEVRKRLREQQVNVETARYDLSHIEKIDDLFDEMEFLDMPGRISPQANQVEPEIQTEENPFNVFEQKNTKTKEDLFMASPKNFLGKEDFNRLKDIAESNNGYYSSYKNKAQNIRAGFTFRTEEDRNKFLSEVAENNIIEEPTPDYNSFEKIHLNL